MIPCRKCIGCKTDHAKEWALRAKLENKNSPNNYFITLTYKDEYIPKNKQGKNTLKQKDLITFINSLKKHFKRKHHIGIKYLASSEYGTKTKRPHYHICFFNLPLTDTEYLKKKKGNNYYISKTIDKIWNKGIHVIGKTTYESAGYTARYTLKKLDKIDYKKNDIEPEKLTMSKGIGLKYFEENWNKIYKYDYIPTDDKNFKPPKYYDRKLKEINPELLEEIKKNRREIFIQNLENEINSQQILLTEIMGNKQRRLYKNLKKFLNHWETKTNYLKLNKILLKLKSENKISQYGSTILKTQTILLNHYIFRLWLSKDKCFKHLSFLFSTILKVDETMRRKHIKMTRKHRKHFKNSARKTRIANTMPTTKRGGYRA